MASIDAPKMVQELMIVEYPFGTHLSASSVPGKISALVRDGSNQLTTHAALSSAADFIRRTRAKSFAVGMVAGVAVTIIAWPHVKDGVDNLRSKLNRRSEPAPQGAGPEPSEQCVEEPRDQTRPLRVVA